MARYSNFALVVGLEPTQAEKLAAEISGNETLVEKLGKVATTALRELARGGALIPHEWAERVDTAIGTLSPQAIVEHVEKAVNRQGDAVVIPWVVDPTQIAYYQTLAENAGITLERQLKSIMDYAYAQGWLGMAAPEADKILLTREQYAWLQEQFGKDIVTGEDVIERLRAATAETAKEAEDFILDSLAEE